MAVQALDEILDIRIQSDGLGGFLIAFYIAEGVADQIVSGIEGYDLEFSYDAAVIQDLANYSGEMNYAVNTGSNPVLAAGYDTTAFMPYAADTPLLTLSCSVDPENMLGSALTDISINLINGDGQEISATGQSFDLVFDTVAPEFVSDSTVSVEEGVAANALVYQAQANDESTITYALGNGSDSALTINAETGEVRLTEVPDFDKQSAYNFTVLATDLAGNQSSQAVTLTVVDLPSVLDIQVTDLDTGAYKLEFYLSEEMKAILGSSQLEAIQVDFSIVGDEFSALSLGQAFFSIAQANIDLDAGQFSLGAADLNTYYGTAETAPLFTLNAVPVDASALSTVLTNVDIELSIVGESVQTVLNDQYVVEIQDQFAPLFSSAELATVDEFSAVGTVVYQAVASDRNAVTYSLTGDSAAGLAINSATGEVTLTETPLFSRNPEYRFTVVASDAVGNSAQQDVVLTVNDLPSPIDFSVTDLGTGFHQIELFVEDSFQASFSSGIEAAQVEFAFSTADVLQLNSLNSALASFSPNLDLTNGLLTLGGFDLNSYDPTSSDALFSFRIATDEIPITLEFTDIYLELSAADGHTFSLTGDMVSLDITDTFAPVFTSLTTAAVDENIDVSTVVYVANATDYSGSVTYTLSDDSDAALTIDAISGEVRLSESPDFESQSTYKFAVEATDTYGNLGTIDVTLNINDLLETPTVYEWNTHKLLPDVTGDLETGFSVPLTANDTGRVVSASDALAALKLAVGLNPNSGGKVISPYQYMAADVNQDGRVTAADALNVLKMAVGLDSAPEREWVLISERSDFWDETTQSYTITRSSIDWATIGADLEAHQLTAGVVSVLKGDVNASWTGDATYEQLGDSYFTDLEAAGVAPAEQWWVV